MTRCGTPFASSIGNGAKINMSTSSKTVLCQIEKASSNRATKAWHIMALKPLVCKRKYKSACGLRHCFMFSGVMFRFFVDSRRLATIAGSSRRVFGLLSAPRSTTTTTTTTSIQKWKMAHINRCLRHTARLCTHPTWWIWRVVPRGLRQGRHHCRRRYIDLYWADHRRPQVVGRLAWARCHWKLSNCLPLWPWLTMDRVENFPRRDAIWSHEQALPEHLRSGSVLQLLLVGLLWFVWQVVSISLNLGCSHYSGRTR